MLFITARADRARVMAEQIHFWASPTSPIHRLPNPDTLPDEKIAWGMDIIGERLAALAALKLYQSSQNNPPPFIITSARALMQPTLPPSEFPLQELREGQQINITSLLKQWVEWGYQAEAEVSGPGMFSRRGGILDIFPPMSDHPIRLELFGDEIDSIRYFDPMTQRSANTLAAQSRLDSVIIGPATESKSLDLLAVKSKDLDSTDRLKSKDLDSADTLNAALFDYFPPDTLVFVEDMGGKMSKMPPRRLNMPGPLTSASA